MSYNIALNFEDGVTRFINCNEGETVLDAAYRNQINLPMDCSDGVCGTCKGACQQGSYELGDDYIEEALTEDEAEQGMILTCQMVPSSDCVVSIPAASTLCKTGQLETTGTVSEVNLISPSAIELKITADADIAFLPGQYVNITVPGTSETRAYSFSSRPGSRELSFLIRNVPGGLMSSWLVGQAKTGDKVTLAGPMGIFYLRPVGRPLLMLAGGTGLAPFLSMLEHLKASGSSQPVHLIYGVTNDEDLVAVEALEAYAADIESFTFKTVVADAQSGHPRTGYVTNHMEDAPINDGDVDVYLCGPPPMVDAVLGYFREEGIEPASFHYERFTPSVAAEEAA
ncbi:benzoate 1,2-dioxygenase electron transfer component BenC [Halopseudomonas formosensis]|uniref:Benzoate 1,2-dioxygenase electron transfer component BenC n=1 Tax=Halopseudomonas formosensis TaxID=1002526 RepID=A0ABU5BUJ6_9GAMM|nr:benzoate 1,2-dioxygenase electron transfer component BenC [Halopseudomonas formosensis]MDX9686351.1 benzoate 1,2-dioxygenase electron transfer component BenC [Halopseudomonas formosensis]